jgi:hypothetical protein
MSKDMNESFDINRYIALARPLYLKKSLIGGAILCLLMAIFSFYIKTNNLIPLVPIYGGAHWITFIFMKSRSDLSRFLLQPATGHEKFAALVTKAILYPTIELFIIVLLIRIINLFFPSMAVNVESNLFLIILYVWMFVVLFALRVQFQMNGFISFILFNVIMIASMIADKLIYSYLGGIGLFPFYRNLIYISAIIALLTLSFFQLKRMKITRIKE